MFSVARVVAAGANLVGVALTTRYLGPDEFGSLTIALVFLALVGPLADLGLYTIATRELAKTPAQEARLVSNVFTIGLVLSAVTALLAVTVLQLAYSGGGDALVRKAIVVLLVPLLLAAPAGTIVALLIAREQIFPILAAALVSNAVLVGGLIFVTSLDLGFEGVVSVYAVSGFLTGLVPLPLAKGARNLRPAFDRDLWRQLVAWALPQGGIAVLGHLYFRLDTFLLSFYRSDSEVAIYGAAYRVVEVLVALPFLFVLTLFPTIARAGARSTRLAEVMQGATYVLQVVTVPVLVFFIAFAPEVIEVLGGSEFSDAAPVLRILMVNAAIVYVGTLFFQALVALGRQKKLFWLLLAVVAVNVPVNLVLIPLWGAEGAALAVVISELAAFALALRLYRDVGPLPRIERARATLLAGGAMAVVAAGFKLLPVADALPALIAVGVGAALCGTTYLICLAASGAMPPGLPRLRGRPRG